MAKCMRFTLRASSYLRMWRGQAVTHVLTLQRTSLCWERAPDFKNTMLPCKTPFQLSYYNLNQQQHPIIINNTWWFLFYSCQGLLEGDLHTAESTLLGNPSSLSALQSGKPLHLNLIRVSLMSLFTSLPILPALRQSPFEGYLCFRLKQTYFFRGRLSAQQYHTVLQAGVDILPAYSFPCFTLPPFGLFTLKSVGHILLCHPPSPARASHNLQLSCRVRQEAQCCLPAHCTPAAQKGPHCP